MPDIVRVGLSRRHSLVLAKGEERKANGEHSPLSHTRVTAVLSPATSIPLICFPKRARDSCPRQRDRMQTPTHRPLLPTSHRAEYLQAAMFNAKSLFHRIFRITPTVSGIYRQISRNSMKTRISGGGGEGGTPRLSSTLCHPERSDPATAGERSRRTPLTLLTLGVFVILTISPSFAQSALTDPTKLQSRNVENMQTFTVDKLSMTRSIGGTTWSSDGR